MKIHRNGTIIVGTAAVLFTLIGCSAATPAVSNAASVKAANTSTSAISASPALVIPSPIMSSAPTATPTPTATAPAAAACAGTPAGVKQIYVSIAEQHLWACTGEVLLTNAPVTTGASALTNVHNATPLGTTRITGKTRNTVLAGKDINGSWNDPVSYWMPFTGGIGLHDASWQTFPLGSQQYKTEGSHGCIHVQLSVIATLFDWASVGTLVTVRQ